MACGLSPLFYLRLNLPHNFLVGKSPPIQVVDFGLNALAAQTSLTEDGTANQDMLEHQLNVLMVVAVDGQYVVAILDVRCQVAIFDNADDAVEKFRK